MGSGESIREDVNDTYYQKGICLCDYAIVKFNNIDVDYVKKTIDDHNENSFQYSEPNNIILLAVLDEKSEYKYLHDEYDYIDIEALRMNEYINCIILKCEQLTVISKIFSLLQDMKFQLQHISNIQIITQIYKRKEQQMLFVGLKL